MGSAASSITGGIPVGSASNGVHRIRVDELLPTLFEKVKVKGNYIVESVTSDESIKRVPALGVHSKENLHAAVALGRSNELLGHIDGVLGELAGRMDGDFWRDKFFAEQWSAIRADLGNFLMLADDLACPALIVAGSAHVSIDASSPYKIELPIRLDASIPLGETPAPEQQLHLEYPGIPNLKCPRIPKGLSISLGDSKKVPKIEDRFEVLKSQDRDSGLFLVKRSLDVRPPFPLPHRLVTCGLGFAPDDTNILTKGHWHTHGQWAELTVHDAETGSDLLTRNQTLDAWLFTSLDLQNQLVWGMQLHIGMSPEGKLLDIDATERYVPTYLELHPVFRYAVEKAVYRKVTP